MRRSFHITMLGLMAAFAVWCAISLQTDLARVSFAPLWRSADVLLLAVLLSLCSYTLRAFRWRWYLRRLGHPLGFWFSAVTYVAGFAFTLSPGKIGEMMRARYYVAEGIPVEHVVAAFSVERLLDALAMLALATLGLRALGSYGGMLWPMAILIAVGVISLTALRWGAIVSFAETLTTLPRLLVSICTRLARALYGARVLLHSRTMVFGFVMGIAAWSLEGAGLSVLSLRLAPAHLDALVVVGIYGVAVLLGALSFLPGGLGSTESVMIALLAAGGYAVSDAILMVLVCRLVTLWLGVLLGWLAVAALHVSHARCNG